MPSEINSKIWKVYKDDMTDNIKLASELFDSMELEGWNPLLQIKFK